MNVKKKPSRGSGRKRKSTGTRSRTASSRSGKTIHVVTDGTGGLPRHFLTAILSQFPGKKTTPKFHIFCDLAKIESLLKKVSKHSIIFHALADLEGKRLLAEIADRRQLPHFDLTGGAVAFLTEHTGWSPINDVQRVHAHDERYLDRIDAWEFTMQHDDSRRLESVGEAEIILIGLSRVSKTPTAAYLGWLGRRVANISIVPEIGVPAEVKKFKRRVVALTMQPKRLSEVRARRMEINRFAEAARQKAREFRYSDVRDTVREVAAAEAIYRRLGLPIIDVTDTTVEETAAKVLEVVGLE